MGWSCQHDVAGECKLLNKPCVPGMKGCIINKSEYTISTGNYKEDKKNLQKQQESIDFAALAKFN